MDLRSPGLRNFSPRVIGLGIGWNVSGLSEQEMAKASATLNSVRPKTAFYTR